MISVYCHNNQHNTAYPHGTSLMEVAKAEGIVLKYPLLGALVNNKVRDMNYLIHKSCQIRFFDGSSAYGNDMYKRSLYFMLFKVVSDLLPNVCMRTKRYFRREQGFAVGYGIGRSGYRA